MERYEREGINEMLKQFKHLMKEIRRKTSIILGFAVVVLSIELLIVVWVIT